MRYLNVYGIQISCTRAELIWICPWERPFQKSTNELLEGLLNSLLACIESSLTYILFKYPSVDIFLWIVYSVCVWMVYGTVLHLYPGMVMWKNSEWRNMLLTWGENTHSTCKPCGLQSLFSINILINSKLIRVGFFVIRKLLSICLTLNNTISWWTNYIRILKYI